MSWFRHVPPKHPPYRPHPAPFRTSPATEKILTETKEKVRSKKKTKLD